MANQNNGVEAVRPPVDQSTADDPKHTEQDLLADLRRVAGEADGPLSEREYAARGRFGVTTFRRRFGSWNAAKRRADLRTREPERIDEERLLDDVRRVARSVDGRLSERTYADEGEFGVTTLRRRFGSWNEAKRRAGLATARRESTTEAMADDIARVAGELEAGYVTPAVYAERGRYPLSALPADDAFWNDLRSRIGLSITPLYHKMVSNTKADET